MHNSSKTVMHTDEHPYRSPATIASLRPVTLRPYLSISLPSERIVADDLNISQKPTDEWSDFQMNGKADFRQKRLNQSFFRK
jgi:hypothetical protein